MEQLKVCRHVDLLFFLCVFEVALFSILVLMVLCL
jgi:hypothetical protein